MYNVNMKSLITWYDSTMNSSTTMTQLNQSAKIEPQDPYECWVLDCNECVYWDVVKHHCAHPEVLEREQWM